MYFGNAGYYIIKNPMKVINKDDLIYVSIEKVNEIFNMNFFDYGGKVALLKYKSKLENAVIEKLDNLDIFAQWGYEVLSIPYMLDGKSHKYYPDIFVQFSNGEKELWEIKPRSIAMKEPTGYQSMREEYKKNDAKWEYAKKWCAENGMTFRIVTE